MFEGTVWSSGRPMPNVVEPPNTNTFTACGSGGQGPWSLPRRKPFGSTFTNCPRHGRSLNCVNGSYSGGRAYDSSMSLAICSSLYPGKKRRTEEDGQLEQASPRRLV